MHPEPPILLERPLLMCYSVCMLNYGTLLTQNPLERSTGQCYSLMEPHHTVSPISLLLTLPLPLWMHSVDTTIVQRSRQGGNCRWSWLWAGALWILQEFTHTARRTEYGLTIGHILGWSTSYQSETHDNHMFPPWHSTSIISFGQRSLQHSATSTTSPMDLLNIHQPSNGWEALMISHIRGK